MIPVVILRPWRKKLNVAVCKTCIFLLSWGNPTPNPISAFNLRAFLGDKRRERAASRLTLGGNYFARERKIFCKIAVFSMYSREKIHLNNSNYKLNEIKH